MTATMTCPTWCEEVDGHDGPCIHYSGSLTDESQTLGVTLEQCGSDAAPEVLLARQWRNGLDTIALTPTEALHLARHLEAAARKGGATLRREPGRPRLESVS